MESFGRGKDGQGGETIQGATNGAPVGLTSRKIQICEGIEQGAFDLCISCCDLGHDITDI